MKNEQGAGTVRPIRDRKTLEVLGYQALLPRELSKPPEGCKNPSKYQQPLGPRLPTWEEARTLLTAAIIERTETQALRHGLPLSLYCAHEIKARLHEARREYGNAARAEKSVSTWRSIDRVFLKTSPFYDWPPAQVGIDDLQRWFDWLRDEAENQKTGEPLSATFIRNVAQFLRAAFARAKVTPNPVDGLELPAKSRPRVVHLDLAAQRAFFGSEVGPDGKTLALEDRTLAGCGMGAGLRVNELLSLEVTDLFLDGPAPHLIVRYGGDHHAPPKGRRIRRVELYEPGLGFWRLWMKRFYAGGVRVFEGPKGGYLKSWPELFPGWSELVGKKITSHVMRHSFAVAMLSGSWGYDPQSLEFVQQQLGHADRTTTERYYGAYEVGTWQKAVARMVGREPRPENPKAVTALQLLGLDVSADVSGGGNPGKRPISARSPSLTQNSKYLGETPQSDASTHQVLRELAVEVLQAFQAGERPADARLILLAREALRAEARASARVRDDEPGQEVG